MTLGDIYWADYGVPFGSEPGFRRPVIIVQDDEFNAKALRAVLVVPLSANISLADAPANVYISSGDSCLPKDSVAVVCHAGAIDKSRLVERVSKLANPALQEISDGLMWVYGLG